MTLAEIADFVTTKIGDTSSGATDFCKKSVNNRYKMIWDNYVWNDSKVIWNTSLPSGDIDITVVDTIERVIGVAWNNFPLRVTSQDELIQWNPEYIEQLNTTVGSPLMYSILPRDASNNQVIRIHTKPTTTQTVTVIGKRKYTDLLLDDDAPTLTGCDNCLLAFVEADMLEWDEQRGSAQGKVAEANNLLSEMRSLETSQQGKRLQLLPEINDWSYRQISYGFGYGWWGGWN